MIRNPLNLSHIIHSCTGKIAIRNEHEINNIICDLVEDVDDAWYLDLAIEVERARNSATEEVRGNDGKSIRFFIHII